MPQGLVRLTLEDINLVDALARPQGLDDGVAPLDDAVGLGGQRVFLLFIHIGNLAVKNLSYFRVSISHRWDTIKLNLQKLH